MKPLKICIFTETYYPVVGGGETQAKLMAETLIANGHSVIVLTRRSDKLFKKNEQYGAVKVYRLPPSGSGQWKKWGLLFSSFPMLIRLNRHYDLIFVSGFRIIGIAAVLISKLFGKSCILKSDSQGEMSGDFFTNGLQKHGLSQKWLPFKLFIIFRNRILSKADAFSAISPEIAAEYSSAGINPDHIHIIPNSVDTTRFFPVQEEQKICLRNKLGLPINAKIVTYSGRLVSYKGLPLLLRVWRDISRKYKTAYLLLLGTGGLDIHNCEAELHSYIQTNGLEPYVRLTGNVQNVPEYLQASDIFVFPTEDDAFPSSLIEAMACALPVVTTPVGAIKTIVKDEKNGIVIQPGDFQQLYRALDKLVFDPQLVINLGQAGLSSVQAHYSAEIVLKQYLILFDNILNPTTASSVSPS